MKKVIMLLFYIGAGVGLGIALLLGGVAQAQNFSGLLQPETKADKALLEDAQNGAPTNESAENVAISGAPAGAPKNESTESAQSAENVVVPSTPAAVPQYNIPKASNDSMAVDDSTYTLGVNDVIEITVARHPEVSKQYVINSEGKIQYEFVGDIQIEGLTKQKATDLVAQRLSTYIVSPEVTIKIVGYNSKVVYIIGEVGVPGKIFMRGDTITVREALVQAGLPLLSASTRKCRLITPAGGGNAQQKYVDVFALLYEGDLRQNFVMKPGDTLYIPATVLAKAMRVISPVTQPVTVAAGAARPVMTGGF